MQRDRFFTGTLWIFPAVMFLDQPWTLPTPGLKPGWQCWELGSYQQRLHFFLYFRVLQTAGASNVVLVTFLVPVSASGLGVTFLGEELAVQHITAYLLIAAGLAVIDGRIVAKLSRLRLKSYS